MFDRLRDRLPDRLPTPPVQVTPRKSKTAVFIVVYSLLFVAAMAFAVGITLTVWERVGGYLALATAGFIGFVYAYASLQAIGELV